MLCAVCGKRIEIIYYRDKTYHGGHYFGEIPIFRSRDIKTAKKKKIKTMTIGSLKFPVLDIKPYKYEEYWECPKCYWKK